MEEAQKDARIHLADIGYIVEGMKGYKVAVESETLKNENFRRVLFTAPFSQLVLMCLQPGEEIGAEVHEGHDQFFRFESGEGKVYAADEVFDVKDGDAVVIPAGTNHNVVNTGLKQLKLYTIYSPANHPDGTIHVTKQEAMAAEKDEH